MVVFALLSLMLASALATCRVECSVNMLCHGVLGARVKCVCVCVCVRACVCVCVCTVGGPTVKTATKRALNRENAAPVVHPADALQPSSAKKSAFSATVENVTAFDNELTCIC